MARSITAIGNREWPGPGGPLARYWRNLLPPRRQRYRTLFPPHDPRPESSLPWPRVKWAYSLLLPIGVLFLAATLMFGGSRHALMRIQVISAASGDAMPGALVHVGDAAYRADDRGEVRVVRPEGDVKIRAEAGGFTEVDIPGRVPEGVWLIQMQPSLVNGIVKDAETGEPISGAEVALMAGEEEPVSTSRSDLGGAYVFKHVPADAVIGVEAEGYEPVEVPIGSRSHVDIELSPSGKG